MVYEKISSSIDKFYNNLALDNKHFRFIDAVISENGEVVIPLLTTFSYVSKGWPDHLWYFDDVWELCDICGSIFPPTLIPHIEHIYLTYIRLKAAITFTPFFAIMSLL